ncbi:hypothetical protein [Chitinophaga rhizophila]|uniref:PH domain-containing protein n=1 Tax=Chitinophaga rhizophila TaxID=2866212 RepID=A0ABS7GHL2_9BACT|nr:hypothetical protein [Chitinophaga rhizophila]MBW8687168.1 hypothetical protein [Chitinophaga rhizophila]
MNQHISVGKAISRGHLILTFPFIVILSASAGGCIYLNRQGLIPTWMLITGIVLSIVLACLYWSFFVIKWRLWAFEHVRDVHELKQTAIEQGLIWPDDSLFTRTEIRSTADKVRWMALQGRFYEQESIEDDLTIPSEIVIPYSASGIYVEIGTIFLCLPCAILFLRRQELRIAGIILLVAIGLMTVLKLWNSKKKKPPIIISNKGIQAGNAVFSEWRNVRNPSVVKQGSANTARWFLHYTYPGGQVHIDINDYNTSVLQLKYLLKLYRARNQQRTV